METGKKEILYLFGYTSIFKFIAYLLLLVLANFYIKNEYGAFSFVYSLFNISLVFILIGIPQTLTPWLIKKKEVSSIFYTILIISLFIMSVGIILFLDYIWILPLIFLLPLMVINGFSTSILRSYYKYHIVKVLDIIVIIIALILAVILKNHGKAGIIIAYSVGYLISTITSFYITRKDLIPIIKSFTLKLKNVKEYIKMGFITSLIALSASFLTWLDSSILGFLSTLKNVADYQVSSSIANIMIVIPLSLGAFLLTRVAKLNNEQESLAILNRTTRISLFLVFLATILLNVFSRLIISIFFPAYKGIEIYIMILSIGIIFYSIYALAIVYLNARLTPHISFTPIIIASLTNGVLDILLIPKYGIIGIACATVFAHIIALILFYSKIKNLGKFLPIVILTPLIPLSFYLGYYGLILIIVSILLFFILKLIRLDDLLIIKQTITKVFKAN